MNLAEKQRYSGIVRFVLRVTASLLVLSGISGIAYAQTTQLQGQDLVSALKNGGYTIYFRHEATDWSLQDRVNQRDDWLSCDPRRMRQLSSQGRQRAGRTGDAIRALGIPVGRVFASPYCRTMDTARQLNLGEVTPSDDVMNLRVAEYFGGRSAIVTRARALLATAPSSGRNNVVVAHGNVAREATPVYPDEGEAVVFKADGQGGFDLVGRIGADQWSGLLQTAE